MKDITTNEKKGVLNNWSRKIKRTSIDTGKMKRIKLKNIIK